MDIFWNHTMRGGVVNLGSSIKEAGQCIFLPGLGYSKLG